MCWSWGTVAVLWTHSFFPQSYSLRGRVGVERDCCLSWCEQQVNSIDIYLSLGNDTHVETFNNILYTKSNTKHSQLLDNKTLDLD